MSWKYYLDNLNELDIGYQKDANENTAITGVKFAVSRYNSFVKSIVFDNPMFGIKGIREAINKAEEFLSQSYSEQYYEKIRNDSFFREWDYQKVIAEMPLKGDLLGDCRFLEKAFVCNNGVVILSCGS